MVRAHAWRVMWNRLPTKMNLQKRNILSSSDMVKCALCGEKEESGSHIFFECDISYKVWMSCYNWLGMSAIRDRSKISFQGGRNFS
ncbi:hypothetical protein ACS0TY_027359 [Phlomoides rotata]